MTKYIVEFSFQYEDLFDTNQFSIETSLSVKEIEVLIYSLSEKLETIKNSVDKKEISGNVIFLNKTENSIPLIDSQGNLSKQFRDLATLRFNRGCIIIPLGLILDTLVVMTPDEWFEYCLLE